jgi:peptidoglycan/xylan/chitin deacetylase (PgdA/CDA1 family)
MRDRIPSKTIAIARHARGVPARTVKRALHPVAVDFGEPVANLLESALRRSSRRVGIALLYHSVDPVQGDPEVELVPAHGARLFEAQVRYVARRYRVVPADRLLSAADIRTAGEPFPVAITFDDDLACHTSVVTPILTRYGATATFFLTGASLMEPFAFWWQRLQRAVDDGLEIRLGSGKDGERGGIRSIHELGREIERMTPAERDRFSEELGERLGKRAVTDGGLSADGVRALVAGGMSIGFHTRRHDPLPSLDDDALRHAMSAGRDELQAVAGSRLSTIAYPHGHVDDRVAEAARRAPFDFGFTTRVEPVAPGSDPLLLGRVIPSYRSVGHLALQLVTTLMRRSPVQP